MVGPNPATTAQSFLLTGRLYWLLYSAWLVAVKIQAVAIEVFHGELTQTPGLLFERLNDSRAQGAQFIVCGIDVGRKYPVNRRLEGLAFAAEEDRDVISRHGADLLS